MGFGHLHVHTEYSPLDGLSKITEVVARAKELGQNFCAITDHGGTYGLWKFQQECLKQGIKPILGEEFYFLNGYKEDGKPMRGHLILLAKNDVGLKNIYALQEKAYVDGFYMKPTITMDMLKEHATGLICTSACLANIICQSIIKGQFNEARLHAKNFKELFGEDFYLEIQPNSLPEQYIVNRELIDIGKRLSIEIVATNDTHYVLKEDASVHEVLLAIATQKKMDDPKRWKFPSNDFWFKSEKEMRDTFNGIDEKDIDNAINNTAIIADKCNCTIVRGNYLPTFPFVENGFTALEQMSKEIWQGYEAKKVPNIDTEDYVAQVQHEIEVINRNGYCDYFLLVQDFIRRAREAGILVGDGRGSGAGSKSCYAMDITRVEPEQYNLLFERFMADGREPDIDTDFSDIDALFELLGEAYGWENVARIVSFGTFAPKAVTRKVLSIFGHDIYKVINPICKLLPDLCSWKDVLKNKEYLSAIQVYEREWHTIQRMQGSVSHTSMHAGGIIIWDKVSTVLPVKCIPNQNKKRIKRVVCFDMDDLHDIGHFKFDCLGLNTLEVQDMCIKNIKKVHGVNLDLNTIDYEDPLVLKVLANGDVSGIFQLEAQEQRVTEQKPVNFKDVIAINALIRPGTGKYYFDKRSGSMPWSIHPLQESYMAETYGEYVYQEQFMQDAHLFAGWSIAQADKMLRKNRDIRNDVVTEALFKSDCKRIGLLSDLEIDDMWERICECVSGGYSFNKSHSACYARIAFQETHMKLYYPECFYSALMTKNGDDQEKVGEIINECKSKSIQILPPDINKSSAEFVPTVDGIRYRLTTIKGFGNESIRETLRLRPILCLDDLLSRRTKSKLKNNNIENLIKSGAFDFEQLDRGTLMHQFLLTCRTPKQVREDAQVNVSYDKANWEYDSLGLFLTEHILDRYAFKPLSGSSEGTSVLCAGIVASKKVFPDKRGNTMAFITISNQYETIKLICFSSIWKPNLDAITIDGSVIYVKGKKQGKEILVNEIKLIDNIA